jgi:LysM repeat protein
MKRILGAICILIVWTVAASAQQPKGGTDSAPSTGEIIKTNLGAEIPEQPELEPNWGGWVKQHYPRWREHYWIDRGPWPGANQGIIYRKEQPKVPDVAVAPEPPEGITKVGPTGETEPKIVEQPAPKVEKATPKTYTVKKGDCLWFIAGKVYSDPLKWTKIFRANKGKIKNPDRIYPGQVLEIPPLN